MNRRHNELHDVLDPKASLLDWTCDATGLTSRESGELLHRFLFTREDLERPIGTLSGGEKSRIQLARLVSDSVNLLILDTQYTLDEAIEKYDWGHSSYSLAVDFAAEWDVEKLVLFHHEPSYEDAKMYGILKSAKWYLRHLDHDGLSVYLAREEMEIRV